MTKRDGTQLLIIWLSTPTIGLGPRLSKICDLQLSLHVTLFVDFLISPVTYVLPLILDLTKSKVQIQRRVNRDRNVVLEDQKNTSNLTYIPDKRITLISSLHGQ